MGSGGGGAQHARAAGTARRRAAGTARRSAAARAWKGVQPKELARSSLVRLMRSTPVTAKACRSAGSLPAEWRGKQRARVRASWAARCLARPLAAPPLCRKAGASCPSEMLSSQAATSSVVHMDSALPAKPLMVLAAACTNGGATAAQRRVTPGGGQRATPDRTGRSNYPTAVMRGGFERCGALRDTRAQRLGLPTTTQLPRTLLRSYESLNDR